MTRDDLRRQADQVRAIPLEVVLTSWGAAPDRRDKSRRRTPRGPLSVTGTKFFNWQEARKKREEKLAKLRAGGEE